MTIAFVLEQNLVSWMTGASIKALFLKKLMCPYFESLQLVMKLDCVPENS